MKKRLEAELISIAHRILKLKNKSEIDQLYKETQKLHEALSILKFYEENYNALKSEVSQDEMEQKVESFLAEKETTNPVDLPIVEAEPIAETKEEIIETIEEIEEEVVVEEEKKTGFWTHFKKQVAEEEVEVVSEPREKEEKVVMSYSAKQSGYGS